jgi:hypothetical protein
MKMRGTLVLTTSHLSRYDASTMAAAARIGTPNPEQRH